MKDSLKWRFGAFTFIILAMLFAYMSDRLEYLFDASGLTGKSAEASIEKPLDKPNGKGNKPSAAKAKKPKQMGLVPVLGSFRGGFLSAKRKQPIKIDGNVSDWELRAGQFLCLDCENKSGSESAWVHLMYDDQAVYILGRVRSSSSLSGPSEPISDLKMAQFLQLSVKTDQATAINIWRGPDDKGKVQLHYFMPKLYPRETTGKDENLFTAEDAIYREDGLKSGAKVALTKHRDEKGLDIECMVPWSALCRDISNKPGDGQLLEAGLGAMIGNKAMGMLQLKTNSYGKGQPKMWLIASAPKHPLPIEVKMNNKGKSKLYPVTLDKERSQLRVEWSKPEEPTRPLNSVLPVTPAGAITIDAQSDDWPENGEIIIAENYFGRFGETALRVAADSSYLYLYAQIGDPTPKAGGDMFKIWMKTDKVRELNINHDVLEIDGKDALKKGAVLKGLVGEEFQKYSIESKIPWKLLTANGKKPGNFPITCRIHLNPVWNVQGLVTTFSGEEMPDVQTWATATLMDVPDTPLPVYFISGQVLDRSVGKVVRLGGSTGVSLRNPYATHNPVLNVLPGTAAVDGELEDWDLSGGMFLCKDVSLFGDSQAAWVHAMYDDTNLYLLYRLKDSTPMANTSGNYIVNDMTEFYFNKDSSFMLGQAYLTQNGKETIYSAVRGDRAKKESKEIISSIKLAFKKDADGKGYTQEVSIPLKWLTKGEPLKAGDDGLAYFNVRTSPSMLLNGLEKFGCYSNVAKNTKFHGSMVFLDKGNIELKPIRLLNGKSLPVKVVDGKPSVDLSVVR